ncbi:hypothetical protein JB92DRAFT_3085801 [Gautieria morchelliformis]|nr:hypothetical protein JB92DRAFT_3085801 [Gautieria morchelliformis]
MRTYATRKGLNIHVSKTPTCRAVLRTRFLRQARQDASAPHDDLEDDPPADWNMAEDPPDNDVAAYRDSNCARQEDDPDVQIEDVPEDDLVREEFPGLAGQALGSGQTRFEMMRDQQRKGQLGDYGPFVDQADWYLETWLMDSGDSQTEIGKFLKLDTRTRTRPSYAGKRELLRKINALPSGPEWTCHTFVVHGDQLDYNGEKCTEELDIRCRDRVVCVNELLANPLLHEHMKFAPEKLFTDDSKEDQIINEMWTAQWWWDLQARSIHCDDKMLPLGARIAPVILASDKTQLSRFSGDKEAWPVYISVGHIAKSVRRQTSKRAMILLGYIPVTKLECLSEATRKDRAYRLFHYVSGKEGVLMTCADNLVRRVFPILAAYLADYPEQCLVACHQENSCPICEIAPSDRGEPVVRGHPVFHFHRNPTCTLKALKTCRSSMPSPDIRRLCPRAVDKPFWEDLPHTNIFQCFTPDLLHQLHKGVFKDHLVKWCIQLAGAEEVDRRFQALPNHPGLRYFKKGISTISQ